MNTVRPCQGQVWDLTCSSGASIPVFRYYVKIFPIYLFEYFEMRVLVSSTVAVCLCYDTVQQSKTPDFGSIYIIVFISSKSSFH